MEGPASDPIERAAKGATKGFIEGVIEGLGRLFRKPITSRGASVSVVRKGHEIRLTVTYPDATTADLRIDPLGGSYFYGAEPRYDQNVLIRFNTAAAMVRGLLEGVPLSETTEKLRSGGKAAGASFSASLMNSVRDFGVFSQNLREWIKIDRHSNFCQIEIINDDEIPRSPAPGTTFPIMFRVARQFLNDEKIPTLCEFFAGYAEATLSRILADWNPSIRVRCGCQTAAQHNTCDYEAQITLRRRP